MVKKGFSLVEALIVMAIVAILFACASKVITTRPKQNKQVTSHGYFECYLMGSQLWQRYVRDGAEEPARFVSGHCTFQPPSGVAFFSLNSINPPYSEFQPNINNDLEISVNADQISISAVGNSQDSYTVVSNDNVQNMRNYFNMMYPDSELYNNGNPRSGLMISW